MSHTATRIAEPARHKTWGLTVDKMAGPTEYVVIRYRCEGSRHSEPFETVMRIPYAVGVSAAVASLVEHAAMPEKTATALVFAVDAKLNSPKAADADLGYRPVG